METRTDKCTKIYLKRCRWCHKQFYTHAPNKLYCKYKCQYESKKESWRKARNKQRQRNRLKDNLKDIGTFKFKNRGHTAKNTITIMGAYPQYSEFYNEWQIIQHTKQQTFRTGIYKGKQKGHPTHGRPSLQYQHVTTDDLHQFSISYLKDNQFKCSRCENRTHLIEHGLVICSECGLVLKAPPIHVGFEVDDLLPIKKVAPTPNDFPPIEVSIEDTKKKKKRSKDAIKQAHNNAYKKYNEQLSIIDIEVANEDLTSYHDNDPLNPLFWRKRKTRQGS